MNCQHLDFEVSSLSFRLVRSPRRLARGENLSALKKDSRKAGMTTKDTGFSLLELVVVLFIVSLLTAVVLPTFAGFGEAKLKAEAREMASLFRYMNDSALSRKETFIMKIDLDTNLVSWKGPEGEKTRKFADMTGVTAQSKGMVSTGELIVFFQPLGIQENISVHMSRDNKNMKITLSHISGKVTIKEEGDL